MKYLTTSNKRKGVPQFKNQPAPTSNPTPKQLTKEETVSQVLTAIRQLSVEQQNEVVNEVVRELAVDRKRVYDATQNDYNVAQKNIESFISMNPLAEKYLVSLNENQTKLAQVR